VFDYYKDESIIIDKAAVLAHTRTTNLFTETSEEIKVVIILRLPGDKSLHKLNEYSTLWKTDNWYLLRLLQTRTF